MRTVKKWADRSPDIANLFNPAFCAAILNRVALGYTSGTNAGLPFSMAFLALPVLLHPDSAASLPNTSRSKFHLWLRENPELLIDFSGRANATAPVVREALVFGLQFEFFTLSTTNEILPIKSKAMRLWDQQAYNATYARNAQILGKLFTQARDLPTIFALFGVCP